MNLSTLRILFIATSLAILTGVLSAQNAAHEARGKEIFKQLVETQPAPPGGQHNAGPRGDGRTPEGGRLPRRRRSSARTIAEEGQPGRRYRGTGAKRPMILLAHLDVVEAKREDWSFDPFVLPRRTATSTAAAPPTTRRWPPCSSPT